jgi:hypothetical protein
MAVKEVRRDKGGSEPADDLYFSVEMGLLHITQGSETKICQLKKKIPQEYSVPALQHSHIHWTSPDGKTHNQMDYISTYKMWY